jgi:hypothetical protein
LTAVIGSLALAGTGLVATSGIASAEGIGFGPHYHVRVIASGASLSLTGPDDITAMGQSIFVGYQNGVGSNGEPAPNGNTDSVVVEYSRHGRPLASWHLTGKVDGMTADPEHDRIVATVNEDGNSSLFTIDPDAPTGSQVVHYRYSPAALPHGGGTDAPVVYRGQLFISASAPNPSPADVPAVYRATLSNGVATLLSVFSDEATATVATASSPQYGRQVSLALTDPDSNEVVPMVSPRFAGDFVLDSQGDQQQIYVKDAGRPAQTLSVLSLSQSIDDTIWVTDRSGTLYVTDSADNEVIALSGVFRPGTAFVSTTPADSNNAPPNPGPNYLSTLDLYSGAVEAVSGLTFQPKGLLFVPAQESEFDGEDA